MKVHLQKGIGFMFTPAAIAGEFMNHPGRLFFFHWSSWESFWSCQDKFFSSKVEPWIPATCLSMVVLDLLLFSRILANESYNGCSTALPYLINFLIIKIEIVSKFIILTKGLLLKTLSECALFIMVKFGLVSYIKGGKLNPVLYFSKVRYMHKNCFFTMLL